MGFDVQTVKREQRLQDVLSTAVRQLSRPGVDSPRLVAELLLAHALDVPRTHVLAHLDQPIAHPLRSLAAFHAWVKRCASGEPLAYVIGRKEFYDLDLSCDSRALIPRPETELLVETVLNFPGLVPRGHRAGKFHAKRSDCKLVDVGTGTGCIAISLAAHWPEARVYAVDSSSDALALAQHNAERNGLGGRITFLHGDLLDPLPEPVHIIMANLPYVTTAEWKTLPDHIRLYEPRIALDGGADGLELVRRLLAPTAAPAHLLPGGIVALEIGATQGQLAAQLASAAFPHARVEVKQDYAGLDRLVMIETQPPTPRRLGDVS